MRSSEYFLPTLRETPADAEIVSHQLMLRAGLIRKLGSGLYTWLPLGFRVLQKVEKIVREEMARIHALEIFMPAVQPSELWKETGRWETFGNQLLKMTDNALREYCFGPTHEEVVTDLVRGQIKSHRDLPLTLYQIQTKFRDEIRPRFGVMRAREFIMKDAYSFHLTEASLQETYDDMVRAYRAIFDRMGLSYRAVEADTGAIGGAVSHEFQVLAEAGEDLLCYSDASTYSANIEQATSLPPEPAVKPTDHAAMTEVHTPNLKTTEEVSKALGITPSEMVKTLVVKGREHPLIALVLSGEDALNEIKASKHPWVQSPLAFAEESDIRASSKMEPGFMGPVGPGIPVIVDPYALRHVSFTTGANAKDMHLQNVVWGRDAFYDEIFDLRQVKEGDKSPDGKGVIRFCRGIEVGHVFQLGDKYAKAMGLQVSNEKGESVTPTMGCYGLGVSRIVAAAIEQHHDENGIIWPIAIAPFEVVIIPINGDKDENVKKESEALYEKLSALGFDVLLDNRKERPGVLFSDHDLIGIPHRFVVSARHLENHLIEYKSRQTKEVSMIAMEEVGRFLKEIYRSA